MPKRVGQTWRAKGVWLCLLNLSLILTASSKSQAQTIFFISKTSSDTVVARDNQSGKILWETKIPLCNSTKDALIKENILSSVKLDGASLTAKSRWGGEYSLDPKTGEWKPAGGYCIENEHWLNLETLKPGRTVIYKIQQLLIRVRVEDLLAENTPDLRKLFRTKRAPAITSFDDEMISQSQEETYKAHFVGGTYRALSSDVESKYNAYKQLDESLNRVLRNGRAEVKDEQSGESLPRLLVAEWSWKGCAGNCEAEGHFFVTEDRKRIFFHRDDRRSERFPARAED